MACGVPVIVSDIPVLRETTGGNGLLADPVNPSTWLDAINSLEISDRRQLQVSKGLKWVKPFKGRSAWVKHISDIEEIMSC
jgi:glycosyltransferase involved in cell wall biosynthesis